MPKLPENESAALPSRLTSSDAVYQDLRARILDNVLGPGTFATELDLAETFGVSRTPVREAMVRLRDEGLIELIPRRGLRVLPVSVSDMVEIYQILTSLECTAAELVAQKQPTAQVLKPLERACTAMDRALANDDLVAWAGADETFHLHLLTLCGNPRIEQIVRRYWDQIHRARFITLKLGPRPHASASEHREIIAALRQGDAEAAQRLVRRHRTRGVQTQLATLRDFRLDHL